MPFDILIISTMIMIIPIQKQSKSVIAELEPDFCPYYSQQYCKKLVSRITG